MDKGIFKKVATEFFYYWWNAEGNNTAEGFDKWWNDKGKELVKNCSIPVVVKSLPNDDEIEQAANENADRIFGDDVESDTEWYAMQHGFTDGVEWIKNYLAK